MPAPAFQVNLHCPDVQAEFAYLTRVLGLQPEFRVRERGTGKVVFAGVRTGAGQRGRIVLGDLAEALHGHYDHGAFGKQMEAHPLGTGAVVYCYVPDVDRAFARAQRRGAVVDEPPTDQFWGDRTASFVTPAGYYVTLATPRRGYRFPPAFTERFDLQYAGPWKRRGFPQAAGKRSRRAAR